MLARGNFMQKKTTPKKATPKKTMAKKSTGKKTSIKKARPASKKIKNVVDEERRNEREETVPPMESETKEPAPEK